MVPLDALNASYLEILCDFLMVYLIPTFILQPNFVESIIIYGIVVTHIAYKHMDEPYGYLIPYFINANYHTKHHEIGGGNYGQFFQMWDYLMNTLITTKPKRENKETRKKQKKLKKNKCNDKVK
jgi:sterol desaturase/sphingolipid hydroxylase (fatty acid hydroxylase superfamily)